MQAVGKGASSGSAHFLYCGAPSPVASELNAVPSARQRSGRILRSVFRTQKRPQKCEPQLLGFTLLGPFFASGKRTQNCPPSCLVSGLGIRALAGFLLSSAACFGTCTVWGCFSVPAYVSLSPWTWPLLHSCPRGMCSSPEACAAFRFRFPCTLRYGGSGVHASQHLFLCASCGSSRVSRACCISCLSSRLRGLFTPSLSPLRQGRGEACMVSEFFPGPSVNAAVAEDFSGAFASCASLVCRPRACACFLVLAAHRYALPHS